MPSFETLDVETQDVETQRTKASPVGDGAAAAQAPWTNQPAYLALWAAVKDGHLPDASDGEVAGAAHALTSWTCSDVSEVTRVVAVMMDNYKKQLWLWDDVEDAAEPRLSDLGADGLGLSASEWWDEVHKGELLWKESRRRRRNSHLSTRHLASGSRAPQAKEPVG